MAGSPDASSQRREGLVRRLCAAVLGLFVVCGCDPGGWAGHASVPADESPAAASLPMHLLPLPGPALPVQGTEEPDSRQFGQPPADHAHGWPLSAAMAPPGDSLAGGNPSGREFPVRQAQGFFPPVDVGGQPYTWPLNGPAGNDAGPAPGVATAPQNPSSPATAPVPVPPPPSPEPAAASETVPPPEPKEKFHLPVGDADQRDNVQLTGDADRISLTARDAPIGVILGMIAEQHGLNIVSSEDVDLRVTVKLQQVWLRDALDAILLVHGYTWTQYKDMIVVSSIASKDKGVPALQGREVRVFDLNYVAASDVDKVVKGLLSPVGQSFINQSEAKDYRKTEEQLVVEDLPVYIERVAEYVAQVDRPPRQVLVEAHVLQVQLKDDCKHGINFEEILHIANSDVTFRTEGFANMVNPTALLRVDGTDLEGLIQAIKNTTDAKTLASPKVVVLNGQEARIQVGGQIGYLLTTTTQTSTMQSVNFLDVGVILSVTPVITDQSQVLLQVKPQVSTGRINVATQLPESETTEVETRVMLADGEALVIGGLIKETDLDIQNKVPWLGDVWLIGRLFQRRETTRERNEIIITLLPRIVPPVPACWPDPREIQQATTPLFYGPLQHVDRRIWEPQLPDAGRKADTDGPWMVPDPGAWPAASPTAAPMGEPVPTPAPVPPAAAGFGVRAATGSAIPLPSNLPEANPAPGEPTLVRLPNTQSAF